MVTTDPSVAFLQALEPNGPWLLVAINPNPQNNERIAELVKFTPGEESALSTWINARQGKRNIYFTSNLPSSSPFTTAKREAIQYIRLLHVDVDLPGAATDTTLGERILSNLRVLEPPPTAITFTGGGYQAIWRLESKLSPENISRIEAVNTSLWKLLNGDHCHDVSRLLRLPGTINLPNASKTARGRTPTESYLVEADWTRTWSFEKDQVPRFPDDHQPLPSDKNTPAIDDSGILASLPVPFRRLVKSGDPTNFKGDRSRLGWYITCELIRRGWSDEDITKVLLDAANGAAAHYLDQSNPQDYVRRNLARAHETIKLDWNRNPKTREILTKDQDNIDKALNALGIKLSHDALADRIWLNGIGAPRRLSDAEIDATWLKIQSEFSFLPDQAFFHTVFTVRARENSFHPVHNYLNKVQPTWDKIERIGSDNAPSWLTIYGGVEDTPYTRAVGRLTLVGAVRRMREPGCKFDEMLMLVDPTQGTNKSMAVRTLAVNENWFNDHVPIGAEGREVIESIRGFWIIEAQELAGMSTRDLERVKAFCSRQTDRGRMSYDRVVTDLPRACVFIGTTNEDTIFTDIKNRRYWPVTILQEFDIDRLKKDLDLLWAEAAVAETSGESIRLARDLWPAAAEMQDKYRVEDSWATLIDTHIGNLEGKINSIDLYKIINKQTGSILHGDGKRLGKAMREIGFERKQLRDGHSPNPRWFYVRGDIKKDIYVFRDPITFEITVSDGPPVDPGYHNETQTYPREVNDTDPPF